MALHCVELHVGVVAAGNRALVRVSRALEMADQVANSAELLGIVEVNVAQRASEALSEVVPVTISRSETNFKRTHQNCSMLEA